MNLLVGLDEMMCEGDAIEGDLDGISVNPIALTV
jgi:hypothetical protein